jgi:hypothetical protein
MLAKRSKQKRGQDVRLLTGSIQLVEADLRFRSTRSRSFAVVTAASAAAVVLAACGSSSSSSSSSTATTPKPNTLALTISDKGKTSVYAGPTTTVGGLLQVKLTNKGKAPHGAQLVLILGNHTPAQALAGLGGGSQKTPSWIRAEGGVGYANPGETATATNTVPAGKYLVFDVAALNGGGPGPPAHTTLTVTPGPAGALPATTASVTAANPSKDKYKWEISGLKAGANEITFNSKGTKAIHLLTVVRLKGHATDAQIEKALSSNSNAPPSFVDTNAPTPQTAALDGGKSQTTALNLPPGRYVFFCPLRDRDGGKPHFLEGLLKQVVIH